MARTNRVNLNDRFVNGKQRVPKTGRVDYWDSVMPGMALRVSASGHRCYILAGRFPLAPKFPTRRLIGEVGAITLADARDKARQWLALIGKGIDPKVQEARERAAEQRAMRTTFAAVAADYIEQHCSTLAKGDERRRIVQREFVARWGSRPIADITAEEMSAAIRQIKKRAPGQVYVVLANLKHLMSWACEQHSYGLESSPAERLKAKSLIGVRTPRDRVLTDDELRAVWGAAETLSYPGGSLIQMLILTAQRLNEVAKLSWSEVDLTGKRISLPASRMKMGKPHLIPLAPMAAKLLESVPRFTKGSYVFTNTGAKPVNSFSALKRQVDKASGVTGWTLHDVRRSVRTHFSALSGVQDVVKESLLAHAQGVVHATYDLYAYESEKLDLLTKWEARLAAILSPPKPADVADLNAARKAKHTAA